MRRDSGMWNSGRTVDLTLLKGTPPPSPAAVPTSSATTVVPSAVAPCPPATDIPRNSTAFPLALKVQGYTNACSAFLFHVFGPGTKCWNGGGARARYLNWFHSAGRRSIPAARAENQTCASISGFSYTDEKGAEKVIKVASEKEAEDIAGLYTKKDFAKLSEFALY
ncbi:hypothetical protein ONZ45_g13543 [Pleurotus djamor]|nr:hypothetical protein ONZ45_g13543 [Pleurotus djamor]